MIDKLCSKLADHLYRGEADDVVSLAREALESGACARSVLDDGLLTAMEKVGRDFKDGILFVPEIIVAARAMHAGIEVLRPALTETADKITAGKIALGTVKGDLHDIGKRIVAIMMEGAGFEVVDLGADVAPERFVEAARDGAQLLGMSALLSTTMPMMKRTIDALASAGVASKVRVLAGGAPVTQTWCDEIGADGFAPDAVTAVEVARRLVKEMQR